MKVYSKRIIRAVAVLLILAAVPLGGGCGLFSDSTVYAKTSEGNVSSDGFIYDLYENGEAEITGIKMAECRLIIPDTVDAHPVTSVGRGAFRDNTTINYLTLGANVRRIGNEAFDGCATLIRVDGGASVTEIGASAFAYCQALCNVSLMPELRTISDTAFFGCASLTEMPFADKLQSIGGQAFFGCVLLNEVKLPASFTFLGGAAFAECTSIAHAALGGLREIPDSAFNGCTSLISVELNKKTSSIGASAFRDCSRLKTLQIPDAISDIGCRAFEGTAWLAAHTEDFVIVGKGVLIRYNGTDPNVTVPGNVKEVADAFSGNMVVRSVTVGKHVKKIGEYAFSGCQGLGRVTISGATEIGTGAFTGCETLSVLYLPKSLTSIGKNAFSGCKNLRETNYAGSRSAWQKITVGSGNTALSDVKYGQKP